MRGFPPPPTDSLHHVFIIMEINRETGLDLSPEDTAKLPDLAALYSVVTEALARAGKV